MAELISKMRNSLCLALLALAFSAELASSAAISNCTSTSPLVGLSADLMMVQHQLRGSVMILDDCTFKVTRFDMLQGVDVYWWGALGDDFTNMTMGFPVAALKLSNTYQNDTLEVTLQNYTWDDFRVLSVWDKYTASDFGHILLEIIVPDQTEISPPPESGQDLEGPAPAPGPDSPWASGASPPSYTSGPSPSSEPEMVGHWQPTMFENCVSLSKSFRLRWTVNWASETLDLGLEAALSSSQYMGFGWAKPGGANFMLQADVVIAGMDEKDTPYAEDYYLGDFSECNWDTSSPSGVCPKHIYAAGTGNSANDSRLIHGQQIDGITLIRYQRPLQSTDTLYDVSINATNSMQVIWAIGMMKPSDVTKGNRTPQNHGSNYNYRKIRLGDTVDECLGPMVAANAHQAEVVVADRGTTLVVGSDSPLHYPDPPWPKKVIYINQKEAPLLRVERGVPVTFSVQAGHEIAFYVTDNPTGGTPTSLNQTIYAGGSEAHGVPALPYIFPWQPNRSTPDWVYYQDFYELKRGWKVQVVDGGLSDMYNTSANLADNKVTLFWSITSTRIYLAVRGEVKSGYLAIAFGSGMVNSFSYVGWIDEQGVGQISAYWMDGKRASSIHRTGEELGDQKCEIAEGIITFEFSRPLQPSCTKGNLCRNVIDSSNPLKVVWALGDAWAADALADSNMHTDTSSRPTLVYLLSGAAKVEQLQPVLAVHGFMMFVAWGLLLPGGILGARYLKHLDNNGWFEIHMYSQLSAIAVMLLGLLFAVAELHGFNTRTLHMKVGLLGTLLALCQAANGYFRPKKSSPGESQSPQRVVWQYVHMYSGRSALVVGFVSLVTGISQLANRDGVEHMRGLQWAVFAWFLAGAATVGYIEVQGFWNKRGHHDTVEFDRILGSEDDSQTLLSESRNPFFSGEAKEMEASPARGMEIQLEALG